MNNFLILGGSGFVGSALCERLVRHSGGGGGRISVPSRRSARAKHLQTLPTVEVVQADVHDDAQLASLVAGRDAVVNLVAILHGSEAEFERAHVALPRRLAQACLAAGVRRVVHVSALARRCAGAVDVPALQGGRRGCAATVGTGADDPAAVGDLRRRRRLPEPVCPSAGGLAGDAAGLRERALPARLGGRRGRGHRSCAGRSRDRGGDAGMRRAARLHAGRTGAARRPLVGPRAAGTRAAAQRWATFRPRSWSGCRGTR